MEPIDVAYVALQKLLAEPSAYWDTLRSEADVRMKVIDRMFVEVLGWPIHEIHLENTAGPGFIDYRCTVATLNRLIIEAKKDSRDLGVAADKSGQFFKLNGPADTFLRFLCEMLHPVVRSDAGEVASLRETINEFLRPDGVELFEMSRISGRPVFAARKLSVGNATVITAVQAVTTVLNADYVRQQTDRLLVALDEDAELAIGTAKEFVETICKTILEEKGLPVDPAWDFPKLVRGTMKELRLVPDQVANTTKGAEAIRVLLMNLASVANGMAEVRNLYGTGHGKSAKTKVLQTRHARLAIGAASTLAVFLFETHQDQMRLST